MTRRSVICPCGNDLYERDWDYDVEPTLDAWKCTNCCALTPRTTRKPRTDRPTPSQERVLRTLKEHPAYGFDSTEYDVPVFVWHKWDVTIDDRGNVKLDARVARFDSTECYEGTSLLVTIGRGGSIKFGTSWHQWSDHRKDTEWYAGPVRSFLHKIHTYF